MVVMEVMVVMVVMEMSHLYLMKGCATAKYLQGLPLIRFSFPILFNFNLVWETFFKSVQIKTDVNQCHHRVQPNKIHLVTKIAEKMKLWLEF